MDIKLDKIKAPKIQLRPVRKTSVEYHELLDSVKVDGILQPILVRPLEEGDAYEVVEGNWRRSAAIDAGLDAIPCLVKEFTDNEVALIQLKANAIRPTTTKSEFAARLHRIMVDNEYTVSQMVRMLNKSASWIRKILNLNTLPMDVKKMVDRGEITISNVSALAKLPPKIMRKFIPQAVTMSYVDFSEMCREALKDWREFCQKDKIGWTEYKSNNVVGFLRQMKELNAEIRTRNAAGKVLRKMDANTAMDGWKACLAWVLHLDPDSLAEQKYAKETIDRRTFRMKELRKQNRIYLKELCDLEIEENGN